VAVPGAGGPPPRFSLPSLLPSLLQIIIYKPFALRSSSGAKAKQPTTIRGTNREQRSSRIESARKKKKKKMKMKMIMIMEQEEEACSSYCSSPLRQCRICYDEEDERRSAMESPCACSGSLKVRALIRTTGSCMLFSTACSSRLE
jgi:hypothetical protein